jgi:CMP-N-acetylneuraminic acid synthetase
MKTVAWLPIKLNNERLPGKNTMILGNNPLCCHILETLLQVDGIDETIVFCSNESITEFLPPGVRWIKRSKALDQPSTKAAEIIDAFTKAVYADIYINAHATNPFIKAATIKNGLDCVARGERDSAHVVSPLRNHLWHLGNPLNFDIRDIPRTQDLEPVYEDAGLFVYKREVWLNGRSRYSERPYFMVCGRIEALDIDYPEDFKLAEAIFELFMREGGGW